MIGIERDAKSPDAASVQREATVPQIEAEQVRVRFAV
jgi:hypothetical protein